MIEMETKLKAIGKYWEAGDKKRIYFNNLLDLYGLEVTRYGTGKISSARLNGQKISNTQATKLINRMCLGKLWYDCNSGTFGWKNIPDDMANEMIVEIQRRSA